MNTLKIILDKFFRLPEKEIVEEIKPKRIREKTKIGMIKDLKKQLSDWEQTREGGLWRRSQLNFTLEYIKNNCKKDN